MAITHAGSSKGSAVYWPVISNTMTEAITGACVVAASSVAMPTTANHTPSAAPAAPSACISADTSTPKAAPTNSVGVNTPPGAPDPFDVDAVQTALGACQIAGPALVDLYAWRWLYQNPDADAAALRDTVIRLAAEVWDRHYRAHFGPDRYHTLGAYQHMVAYPLYLPDYALGQIMAHQIRSHMRGRDLASETRRICAIGRVTPDLWLRRAVGAGISPSALMDDAAAAVAPNGVKGMRGDGIPIPRLPAYTPPRAPRQALSARRRALARSRAAPRDLPRSDPPRALPAAGVLGLTA